jgi:hypothetical protein
MGERDFLIRFRFCLVVELGCLGERRLWRMEGRINRLFHCCYRFLFSLACLRD